MLDRLMGAMIAITVVLASSPVAFAQNGHAKSQEPRRPRPNLLTRMICPDFGKSPKLDYPRAP